MKGRTQLAEFELLVTLAVLRLENGAYGAAIRREIEERAGRRVSIGAVYATLARLEDDRLLASSTSEPLPVRGGRSRRFYQLTDAGMALVRRSATMLHRMMDDLPLLDTGKSS